ncbi:HAMP domain-containing sensor histidine kinase [Sutcliffiella rhizosphaerae]|uniref:Signal transduction histidine-protein kinase ArlS n=1 Tax=Sutcliffiella rhizosphaerae TaxID=2880967 RepID=A0ABM8YPY1_9BACI|nr:HAMP domain-containing sensor histidine kinase [Sutcliffiella rhizosphaerae]CAG9622064.1 Signal transduction histidine-protein kinase ArlS [Sutcliffiella rhizosphaerae]
MKLKQKILLFSTVWLLIMLLLVNGAIYFLFQKNILDNDLNRVKEHAQSVTEAVTTAISENETDFSALLHAYLPPNGMIRIVTEENTSVANSAKEYDMRLIPTKFQNQQFSDVRTFDGNPYAVVSYPLIWSDGNIVMLEVTESLEDSKRTIDTLLVVLLIASLFIIIPAIFFGNVLSRIILTPIYAMTKTMKQIQQTGDYKKLKLEGTSKDELYMMGSTFNQMIDILEKNFQKQQQFVSDASHELKTPLTVIESYASMLKRWGMKKPELLEESVEAIYSESIRMKEMTEQMLQLANADNHIALHKEETDLLSLSRQAAHNMEISFDRNITIVEKGHDFHVFADTNKIKQLLYILLDNARKYSDHDILMELMEAADGCSVTIIDKGDGIPSDDLDKIFDRFYRVDKARSRESGGSGLGLSIAKQIVDAHQGSIVITSEEGKGTTVRITLPKQEKTVIKYEK